MTQPVLWKSDPSEAESAAMVGTLWNGPVRLDPRTCARLMGDYNETIRGVARDEHTILIDLAREIPQTLENFCDDVHMTAAGNKHTADVILRELLRDGKLPRAD
jgi:hypothetical protein